MIKKIIGTLYCHKSSFLCVLCAFAVNLAKAQTTPPQQEVPEHKKIIVINNNKFSVYNAWVNFGGGWAHNFNFPWSNGQFNGGIDLNFPINVYYFQIGFNVAGDRFGYYNFLQGHLAYGLLRKETTGYNLACFAGLSYSNIFLKNEDESKYLLKINEEYGLYAQIQAVKKINYDLGVGLSAFADINRLASIIGFKIDAYFSLGYKGKANPYLKK